MRTFRLISFLAFACLLAAQIKAEEVGAWSEPVDGVQGRLIAKEAEDAFIETQIVSVYLELRNMTNHAEPVELYFDPYRLSIQMVDSTDTLISKPMLADMSIFEQRPFWLVLPFDSSIRFNVSVSGYGIPKEAGTAIGVTGGLLLVGRNVEEERFLKATFVSEPGKKTSVGKWRGTIKLPKVLIPRNLGAPDRGKLLVKDIDSRG